LEAASVLAAKRHATNVNQTQAFMVPGIYLNKHNRRPDQMKSNWDWSRNGNRNQNSDRRQKAWTEL